MKTITKISETVGRFMALIVLAVAAFSLFIPKTTLWIQTSWINYLLMLVMFGMGLTLKIRDFGLVFSRPKDIIIGCVAQFTIMPLLAVLIGKNLIWTRLLWWELCRLMFWEWLSR